MSESTVLQKGRFCWNELATTDARKAKEFYSKLFGWTVEDIDMGGGCTYTKFGDDETEVAGLFQIPADQAEAMPPQWMSYVWVDDLAEAVTNAKSLGATIIKDITQVGEMGIFAVISDPTGAVFSLWQKAE